MPKATTRTGQEKDKSKIKKRRLPKAVLEQRILELGRRAQEARCRCGTRILKGPSGDMCAFWVTVDAEPLKDHLEELALADGGTPTYAAFRGPTGIELCWRDPIAVLYRPRVPIHKPHECRITRGEK